MKIAIPIHFSLLVGVVVGGSFDGLTRRDLESRQLPPPSQDCSNECALYFDPNRTCVDNACMCTETFAKGFADCLNCQMRIGMQDITSSEVALQLHLNDCASHGFVVNPQVLQGQGTVVTVTPTSTAAIGVVPSTSAVQTTAQTLLTPSQSVSSSPAAGPVPPATATSNPKPTGSKTSATGSSLTVAASNSTSTSKAQTGGSSTLNQEITSGSFTMVGLLGLCSLLMVYAV